MKKLMKLFLYSTLALVLAAIPATLLAGHRPGGGPGLGHGPGAHFGGGFMAEMIAERLDLSTEQREQVKTIHESYHDEAEALLETAQVARQDLRDAIHAAEFDEASVRDAAARVAAVDADLAVLRAKIASEVQQVLTPEQSAEARALHERMRERAGEWRDRGHRGHGRFGGPASEGD